MPFTVTDRLFVLTGCRPSWKGTAGSLSALALYGSDEGAGTVAELRAKLRMARTTSAGRYFGEQAENVVFLHAGIPQRFLVAEPLTG